jgi:colanic acid biosynthesis glycosyl transferase WcaI
MALNPAGRAVRALLFSQYFTPEVTAASARVHAFARALSGRGHDVEVVCEAPSHPSGLVEPGYGDVRFDRRRLDGFGVTYVKTYAHPSKRARHRVASYASYAALAVAAASRAEPPDVILASSPPLPVGAAAALAARRRGVPWVMDVRDLWPEAAVVLGEISGRPVIAAAERLERALYRSAAAITTTTAPFRDHIREVRGHGGAIEVVPNGTTTLWLEAGRTAPDRDVIGSPGTFTWTYAGNVGPLQDLESAVCAAAELGAAYRLVIVGDGSARERLRGLAGELGANVEFVDLVPPQHAARILRASDAVLVSLGADPVLRKFVPSKLYDCAAIGRPMIVAASGEPARIATENALALTVQPGSPAALAAAVRELREQPARGEELVGSALAFASESLREVQALRVAELLEGLTG